MGDLGCIHVGVEWGLDEGWEGGEGGVELAAPTGGVFSHLMWGRLGRVHLLKCVGVERGLEKVWRQGRNEGWQEETACRAMQAQCRCLVEDAK